MRQLTDLKMDKKAMGPILEFAAYIGRRAEEFGKEILELEMPFVESTLIAENTELMKSLTKAIDIELIEVTEKNKPKSYKKPIIPGNPAILVDNI